MAIHPVRTEADHAAAVARIEALWNAQPGTSVHAELEVLGVLAAAYEEERSSVLPPDPLRQARTEGSSVVPFCALRGQIRMTPDFDATPDAIIESIED